jgi:hypothetical protein
MNHPSLAAGTSQCSRILAALQSAPGEWVSLPALWKASGSMAVHSRINDLRKRGHIIENQAPVKNRKCLSSYRLIIPATAQP